MKNFAQAWVVSFLLAISLTTSTFAAEPKKSDSRIAVGDLVEFTTGMGPMLGEVINGPDPSNYYGILVPSRGEKPINGAKLRLIERAGAPNASFKPGDAVDFRGNGNLFIAAASSKLKARGAKSKHRVCWAGSSAKACAPRRMVQLQRPPRQRKAPHRPRLKPLRP